MTITTEEIARLRALEAKATPGPWGLVEEGRGTRVTGGKVDERGPQLVTLCRHIAPGRASHGDAKLIARMRNALPSLLDEIERLHAYDRALSAVMPADFKDWHQNHPREWPEVAAHVVSNMRQREEDACAEIERLRADLREAMALLRDVDEFANPVGSWQRRDALLAKHKEDA